MTDDAMKRAWEAWRYPTLDIAVTDDRFPSLRDAFDAGWNACKAHHYAEVHELREALKATEADAVAIEDHIDQCSLPLAKGILSQVRHRLRALLAKGDDNVG